MGKHIPLGEAILKPIGKFNDWILEQYELYHDDDNIEGAKAMGLVAIRFNMCINDIDRKLDRIIEDLTDDSDS
jgi:hypothetical protein